ncbi:hypothetical protein [Methylobacterium sp. 17Sr1-1]|uniref:hypothetical protein n=1 Tax=Methylobacterium sp. 17Sr1-1 TaxID=2202826 RepID=UPI000D6EE160|nr:hypothetical protein [Methylobacterium sp. 17Sr1-1]AWN55072.1 hypothetical protein DK412_28485 [Methylobacterium sp. 17Sr1-1]
MTDRAAVAEQVVAIATVETDRGPVAAVAVEQVATATAVAEQGMAGPPGPPGIARALVVRQDAPSASWVLPHSLGRPPLVQITDDAGEVVFPDVIAGSAVVSVIFAQPATGSAILF